MALHGFTRILGITLLLVAIAIVTTFLNNVFVDPLNLSNLLRWTALFGILALGVAFVIITGGIDLSIGSVVALTGIVLMYLLQVTYADTGQTFTIASKDNATNTIQLDQLPPEYKNLDRLTLPHPTGAEDIQLTIDANATAALSQPKTMVVLNSVRLVSTGSVARLQTHSSMNPWLAVLITLGVGAGIGLLHGFLIGYCNLQSFIVTLCGLMAYRGLARRVSNDQTLSLGSHHGELKYLATGHPFEVPVPFINSIADSSAAPAQAGLFGWVALPMPMLILLGLAVVAAFFLHKTVPGRHLLAMGRNAEAARFSGINTKRMTILAYVLCSTLAALGGILFALNINTVQPSSHGNFYELYAIAAAVLGGCSLRGGVGSITGVIIGTAVMRSLYNAINLLEKPTYWEYVIIGVVLLLGVMIDELGRVLIRNLKARRRREQLAISRPRQE